MLILEMEQMAQIEIGAQLQLRDEERDSKKNKQEQKIQLKCSILRKQVCGFYYWDLYILI